MGFLVYREGRKKGQGKAPYALGNMGRVHYGTRGSFWRPKRRTKRTYKVGEFNDEDRTDSHGILSRIRSLCSACRLHEGRQSLNSHGRKKVPKHLVRSIFYRGKPSTEYSKWKQAIIDADNIEREFRDATSHHPTTAASSSKDAAAAHDKTRSKSGSKSKRKDKKNPFFFYRNPAQANAQQTGPSQQKPEGTCFLCGKEGHWKKDCPKQKNIAQLRAQISDLTEAELDCLNESSF